MDMAPRIKAAMVKGMALNSPCRLENSRDSRFRAMLHTARNRVRVMKASARMCSMAPVMAMRLPIKAPPTMYPTSATTI